MRKKVKRKKKHHLNRLKIRKAGPSWFKLVYFDIFFADLFPIFNYYYYLCDQISFKHTSNNLKRYINN